MKCKSLLSYILDIKIVRLNMSIIFTNSPIPINSLETFCKCKFLLIMNVCEFPVFNGRKKVVKIRRNKNKNPHEYTY